MAERPRMTRRLQSIIGNLVLPIIDLFAVAIISMNRHWQ